MIVGTSSSVVTTATKLALGRGYYMSSQEIVRAGIIKRIHVNQHNIRHNAKVYSAEVVLYDNLKPVFTVKCSDGNFKGENVDILGESEMIYAPNHPLSCGAKCWVETKAEVHVWGVEDE